MGMTNEQYKGVLLQWLDDLEQILKSAENANDQETITLVRHKIELIKKMLEF